MKRKTILLDVDGVLADFVAGFLALLESELGIKATREQVAHFDIGASLGLSREHSSQVKRALGSRVGFARELDIYPGAVEGVRLLEPIADVYIVTSPWNSNPTWMHDREHWLEKHFGIPHSRVIHTSAKYRVSGDVLVDDKTDTLGKWRDVQGGLPVQWETPHNRLDRWMGISTNNWFELRELVERL